MDEIDLRGENIAMAEFDGANAYDQAVARHQGYSPPGQPPPPPSNPTPGPVPMIPAPQPFPLADHMPPDVDTIAPEQQPDDGVEPLHGEPDPAPLASDDFLHGYGYGYQAPQPELIIAAEVGTDQWAADIRRLAVDDPSQLQQLMAEHPEQFQQIMLALQLGRAQPTPASHDPSETAVDPYADPTPNPDRANEPPRTNKRPRATDRDDVAKTGIRGWLARVLNVPLSKSKAEQAADLLTLCSSYVELLPEAAPVVIGVTSFKGGCGKTRISVLLARVLAEVLQPDFDEHRDQHWRAPVIALDVDLHGMLQPCSIDTAHVRPDAGTMTTLCSRLNHYSADQINIDHYAHDAADGYHFIPGNHYGLNASITADGYQRALELVKRHYPVIVVDMSQVAHTDLYATVLRSLTGVLIVTPPDEAEVNFLDGTRNMLSNRPGGMGAEHLIKQRVTVINNIKPLRGIDTKEVSARLKLHESGSASTSNPRGSDVAEVPFDKVVSERALIDMTQISQSTRDGIMMLAGALTDTILNPHNRE